MEPEANQPANPMPFSRLSGAMAFLLFLVFGGILPGVYLYLNSRPSQDSAFNTSGLNVDRVKTAARLSPPTLGSEPRPYSPPSSLNMIREGFGGLSARPEETKTPDSAAASQIAQLAGRNQTHFPITTTKKEGDALSEEDASILKKTMGGFDSNTAYRAGTEPSFGYKVATALFSYPRVLRFLLNNETFLKAVINRQTVRQNCNNVQSLTQGIMDTKDPQGVTRGLQFLQDSTRYADATQAILGSKLAQTLSQCPSLTALTHNPGKLAEAFMANPQLVQALGDPNIAKALNSNSTTRQVFGNFSK